MKIDSHQHFWKYDPKLYDWISDDMAALKRDFLPTDLKPLLDRIGFSGCIAVQARTVVEETEWLLKLADEHPFIQGVVGWVDLCSPNVQLNLERLSQHPKLKGIRHIVQSEPDDLFMLREDFQTGLALLEKFDLTYDILIYPVHLPVAVEVVRRFPNIRFVLDHIAKPHIKDKVISPWKERMIELAKAPNVYCKLSGMVTEADWQAWTPQDLRPYIDVAVDAFGVDRVMIGSDWPVCTVAGEYEPVMEVVLRYIEQFSPSEQERILGGNCAEAYRL